MVHNFQTYSDSELYSCLSGKKSLREAAFAEIYHRYGTRLYQYCRRVVGDSALAEDIFQEVFLQFIRSISTEREMTNLPGYLVRIARNLCLNAKRQKYIRVEMEDIHLEHLSLQPVACESEEFAHLIATTLELLPDEHREALVLQVYNGLSYHEIAEVTHVPISTVRNRVVRAKKKIKEILAPFLEKNHL